MKREDFKEILPVHIENCKKILDDGKDFEPNIEAAIDSTTEFLRDSKEQEIDNVNQPNHYKLDGLDVEVLDIIKAVLTKEQFEGFLHGNVIKYTLRTNKKNGVEDLEKAHKYLGWLIESRKE